MATAYLKIKALEIGKEYAKKVLADTRMPLDELMKTWELLYSAFADGYINGYDAKTEGTTGNSQVLTNEILDKNGFVGDTRSAFAYNKGGVDLINLHAEVGEISIYDEKWHDTSGYICRSVNVPSLMDVQTLKQAFHLCGLHELANEFQS